MAMSGLNAVARPPKASRPSTALRPLAGPRAFGDLLISTSLEYAAADMELAMNKQDVGSAKLNPARTFRCPMDVVAAHDIAAADKLAILKAWEADERALQRAEDEGMGGGEHAHLQKVQEALDRLQEEARLV
jgi:hypothetical protein